MSRWRPFLAALALTLALGSEARAQDAATGSLGDACLVDGDCTSGHCADGVCCNEACTGQCEACNGSSPGTCAAVTGEPVGGRPACRSDGTLCGGACSGTDRIRCAYPDFRYACRAPFCIDQVATLAETCDGAGACPPAISVNCAPSPCSPSGVACMGFDCPGRTDSECPIYDYCGNVCLPRLPIGALCDRDRMCISDSCIGGRCCDPGCGGSCLCQPDGGVDAGEAGTPDAATGAPDGDLADATVEAGAPPADAPPAGNGGAAVDAGAGGAPSASNGGTPNGSGGSPSGAGGVSSASGGSGSDAGGASSASGGSDSDAGGASSAAGRSAGRGGSTPSGHGGSAMTPAAGGSVPEVDGGAEPDSAEEGSCACRVGARTRPSRSVAGLALTVALLVRRRRKRSR